MCRHPRAICVLLFAFASAAAQSPQPRTDISIRVLEGDAAINSIRLHRAHDPVVQVVDATGEPVSGATVTFLLPASGPSAVFPGSGLSITVQTGRDGRAAPRGLRPNAIAGQFRIRVTASWQGQTANASILQTNAEPIAKSKTSRTIVILAVVGAVAAGGAAAASHGGSGNSSPPGGGAGGATTGAVITPGQPAFGPPH